MAPGLAIIKRSVAMMEMIEFIAKHGYSSFAKTAKIRKFGTSGAGRFSERPPLECEDLCSLTDVLCTGCTGPHQSALESTK